LASNGLRQRAIGAAALLRPELAIQEPGRVLVPFFGIKRIDLALVATHLA
jgi:high-affinity K+ transport system ATPase subunit B